MTLSDTTYNDTIECAWRKKVALLAMPVLSSQVLLAKALEQDRAYLYAYPEKKLTSAQQRTYESLCARYVALEPLAYLCERTEFYSLDFVVNEHVLIPRPETEVLVDEAASKLRLIAHAPTILDMGTGSGAIAISLGHLFQNAHIVALDISEEALKVARMNAKNNGLSNIQFVLSDWFSSLDQRKFDCIVSNPPYLRLDEWESSLALHKEPAHALIGQDQDGLGAYREIAFGARKFLTENGALLFEHGYTQAKPVRDILQQAGYRDIFSVHDLLGHLRVTGATWHDQVAVHDLR